MPATDVFTLKKGNIYALPILHYNMEMAAQVRIAFSSLSPDCIAVELAETMQQKLLHAASRLPDISVVVTESAQKSPLYYLCEPCDAAFEALRCGLESNTPSYCIDLDVDDYPNMQEQLPDPYAIQRIGLKPYYSSYHKTILSSEPKRTELDLNRELYMAKRLKGLSLKYESVLFIAGMFHIDHVLKLLDRKTFPHLNHAPRTQVRLCTLTENSCRDVLSECGWYSKHYEQFRELYKTLENNLLFIEGGTTNSPFPPDRQKLLYQLYYEGGQNYQKNTGCTFAGYHLRNTMKFVRNYSLVKNRLMPDLFQTLSAAKACVDHNYAYEVWELSTDYPYLKNIDGLEELDLSIEDVWGHKKMIHFHLKEQSRKSFLSRRNIRKDQAEKRFEAPGPFSLCSHQPEDLIIENFGDYLRKKGTQVLTEEAARTAPFTTSLEDGIDTRETIRNWHQKKLFVKVRGRPPGGTGSVVIIFDEDLPESDVLPSQENYPWCMTWLGEHEQESDMAFYATHLRKNIVGPGISRCEYGGLMMSYPPRRMLDVWIDPDYQDCRNKPEILLMAAIDYAVEPTIVYVAARPPRSIFKSFARRFGKKIVYIPIGQLSSVLLNKIRVFHVLDGHDRREIADDYIF